MDRSGLTGIAARALTAASLMLALGAAAPAQNGAPKPPLAAPRSEARVDVTLVLAVDASGSVDDDRFDLQKKGYAAAFRNPKVLSAIKAGDEQQIAVSMVQWTGPTLHVQMIPWMLVKDARSADALAAAIEAAPRQLFGGGTSVSGAIDYSVLMLAAAPYLAERRVIDVSGDGSNNLGRPAEQARDEAVHMGIRINGLPILSVEPDLDQYYKQSVIGGPGAFIIPAKDYNQFADAILRKLVAEIAQSTPPKTKLAAK